MVWASFLLAQAEKVSEIGSRSTIAIKSVITSICRRRVDTAGYSFLPTVGFGHDQIYAQWKRSRGWRRCF